MTKSNNRIVYLCVIVVFAIVFSFSFLLLNYLLTTPSLSVSSPKDCLKKNDRNEQFKLIWSDEFERNGLNETDWIVHDEYTDTCENQSSCDRSENVQTSNGLLILRTMNKKYNGRNYTGAKITTKQYFSRGRYEIRLMQPRGLALRPCIYTVDSNARYRFSSGQIVLTCTANLGSFYRNVYFANDSDFTDYVAQFPQYQNERNQFHLYGFEWNESEIRFFYDQEYGDPIPLNKTKFIKPKQQLRFWIKTIQSQIKVNTDLDWKCPAFLIDYVRIYEKILNSTNETLSDCQNADTNYSKLEIDQICAKITNSEKLEHGKTENDQDESKVEYNLKNFIQSLYRQNPTFFVLIVGLIVFFLEFILYLNFQICAIKRDRRNESNSPEPLYESIIYEEIKAFEDENTNKNNHNNPIKPAKATSYISLQEGNEYVPIKRPVVPVVAVNHNLLYPNLNQFQNQLENTRKYDNCSKSMEVLSVNRVGERIRRNSNSYTNLVENKVVQ